jgi:hypothetical protein
MCAMFLCVSKKMTYLFFTRYLSGKISLLKKRNVIYEKEMTRLCKELFCLSKIRRNETEIKSFIQENYFFE